MPDPQRLVAPSDTDAAGRFTVEAERQRNDSLDELAGMLQSLIGDNETNISRLAERTGFKRQQVSRAVNGREVPSPDLSDALDVVLPCGGAIRRLRDAADREKRARRLGVVPPMRRPSDEFVPAPEGMLITHGARTIDHEVISTNRREFAALPALPALSAIAASTRARIETGSASDRTLDELESDVDEIAQVYGSAPHLALLGEVAERWKQIESILDGRMSAGTRARVTQLGGQLTYFLGRLAFNTNDFRSARRFAGLAGTYADEIGEPVLIMSVAALQSSIAYHTQRYRQAIAALNLVQQVRHPYMDGRMAAYEARAYAKMGDQESARDALNRMEAASCTMAPMPGETPVGPAAVAMFRSGVAINMGDVDMAQEWAPIAIAGYQRKGGDYTVEESQHAYMSYASKFLIGREPEPEEAARIAMDVIRTAPDELTHTVKARLRQCASSFSPAHHRIPAVSSFLEACRTLPAGGTG
ncbi:hypothetical protein [Frankia sp. AgPm24]|uniref:Uncharacterized protein n=1 Tax=Frankia umida TaxID=573489 RepID=A0ABT0K4P8_9ACTN|nr:hypothetical protein [Frankia sp. AgPm24]MCK9878750.1 hypothetical protein [Frankia umida]